MRNYIVAGRLIDGSGSGVRKRKALIVEDGNIIDVIAEDSVPADCAESITDLSHCTILPPLMDCSVDIARTASLEKERQSKTAEQNRAGDIARHIHFCHSHGVLGAADCGNGSEGKVSVEQRRGLDVAVRIRTAGQVYKTSEHGGLNSDSDSLDFVRIVHTGDIEVFRGKPECPGEQEKKNLSQLIGEAHDKGIKAVVLANGSEGVRDALDAGCDALEQGYHMGEENLEKMASRQILWIPALIRAKNKLEVGLGSQKTEAVRELKKQQNLLGKAKNLGLRVAVGTGAGSRGVIHGEAVIEEIQLFIKSGYSLIEALQAASQVGAKFFKIPEIGVLQAGGWANFIVSRGMVQQLPRKLTYLENIYWQGKPSKGYRKNPIKTVRKT